MHELTGEAPDLPVRLNGRYAEQKLSFLEHFLPPALRATKRKPERVYVDLFAGPGAYAARPPGTTRKGGRSVLIAPDVRRYAGSALRTLMMPPQRGVRFNRAIMVNLDRVDHIAHSRRVEALKESGRCNVPVTDCREGDANQLVSPIMKSIGRFDYAFVVADPESPNQWPWRSVEALKRDGPASLDLYVLFPLHMALVRLFAYEAEKLKPNVAALDRFFGCRDWEHVAKRRQTKAHSAKLRADLEELYLSRLVQLGWKHTRRVRVVRGRWQRPLYHMLLATNSDVAATLAAWEATARKDTEMQRELSI